MKSLLLRELRRLAPYALVGAGASLAFPFIISGLDPRSVVVGVAVGVILLPALLAVASVAPDTGSGGVAFLARLPLSTRRVFAAKALAVALWCAVGVGLLAGISLVGVVAIGAPTRPDATVDAGLKLTAAVAVGLFGGGAGLLASVIAHRTMPALLLTPTIVVVAALVTLGVPMAALGAPALPLGMVLGPVLGLACVAVAGVAFVRGERFRRSARPAVVATAGLVPVLLLTVGATSAAHAWSVEAVSEELPVAPEWGAVSPAGDRVAVSLLGYYWTGLEERVAVVDRHTGASWTVPVRGAANPTFSPDGRGLLLSATAETGGWWVDLDQGSVQRIPFGITKEGFGFQHVLWRDDDLGEWRAGEPLLLRAVGGRIEGFLPLAWQRAEGDSDEEAWPDTPRRRTYLLTQGQRFVGVVGQRVVIVDDEGLLALDPPFAAPAGRAAPSGERLVRWAEGVDYGDALISPAGRYVLAATREEHPRVHLYDLELGTRRELETPAEGGVRLHLNMVSFGPDEEALALEVPVGGLGLFELPSGELRRWITPPADRAAGEVRLDRPVGPLLMSGEILRSPEGPVAWSSDGTRVAFAWGDVLDLERDRLRQGRFVVALLDERGDVPCASPLPTPLRAAEGGE